MKLSLWTIIGLLPLAIGVSFVYADEQLVQVPFDTTGMTCSIVETNIFACYFYGGTIDDIKIANFTAPDGTVIEPEIVEQEIVTEPEIKLTREERDIQRMIDKITLDLIERPDAVPDADKQLLELLLRAVDKCEFGIEEGQPIQTYQIFAIPEGYFYPEDTDFAKYNMLGKITKLVEACTKWEDYKVKWLGPQYADIAEANINVEIWSPTATIPYNVTITDEWMNRAISEHDKIEEGEDAANEFCTSQNFGNATKAIYGCDVNLPTGPGGFTDTTENSAWLKYQRYLNDPENAEGEPKYNVATNPKCAILSSFITQYELSEEAGNDMLQAAGCKL